MRILEGRGHGVVCRDGKFSYRQQRPHVGKQQVATWIRRHRLHGLDDGRVRLGFVEKGVEYQRSSVLGLDLRSERRNGATLLVIRDPGTGEEFDGALEASERQRRIAEDLASTAEERVRVLEQRLRDLTIQARPMGRDSWG